MIKLNKHQQEIVDQLGKGITVLNAAAGSGKTTTTKETVAAMINSGVSPRRILAVTFTKKASREWQERIGRGTISGWGDKHIEALDTTEGDSLIEMTEAESDIFWFLTNWCTTIHAACYRLLKEFGDRRRMPGTNHVFEIKDMVNDILEINEWSELSYANALECVSVGITNRIPVTDFGEFISPMLEYGAGVPKNYASILQDIYKAYINYMRRKNLIDFNMMIVDFLTMLEEDASIRTRAQYMFDYLIVDEAQDTSQIQAKILFMLAEKHRNILFVGDPRQSIYQWRGAVPSIMEEEFEYVWGEYQLKSLPINYRSTKEIILKTNGVIARNYLGREEFMMEVNPRNDAPDGAEIEFMTGATIESLADQLVPELRDNPGDWFILNRTNAECTEFHTHLSIRGVNCINMSGGSIYDNAKTGKLLAYLRLASNYDNARNDLEILSSVANVASDEFKSPINKRQHSEFCDESRPWIDCGCPITVKRGIDRAYTRYYGKKSIEKAHGWSGIKNQISHHAQNGERIMYSYGAEDLVNFVEHLETIKDSAINCIDYILEHSIIPYLYHEMGVNSRDEYSEGSATEEFSVIRNLVDDNMSVDEFLEKLDGLNISSAIDEKTSVVIMTVHKSKGLERPSVVVNVSRMPCAIPPVFNSQIRVGAEANIKEERNIFYVAVTRAKERVIIARSLTFNGKDLPESPFIKEIQSL